MHREVKSHTLVDDNMDCEQRLQESEAVLKHNNSYCKNFFDKKERIEEEVSPRKKSKSQRRVRKQGTTKNIKLDT